MTENNITFLGTIMVANRKFACNIKYSCKRTTVQLKLIAADELQITAPTGTSKSRIKKIIQNKSHWLTTHALSLEKHSHLAINQQIAEGEAVLFLGKTCHLTILPGSKAGIMYQPELITIYVNSIAASNIKATAAAIHQQSICTILKNWYLQQSQQILVMQTAIWAKQIGVNPGKIRIKELKSCWGSCSTLGNISYNWRLVMAPPPVIDYLVIHELCHLMQPNHSARFWRLVALYSPTWQRQRDWLKEYGKLLHKLFVNT